MVSRLLCSQAEKFAKRKFSSQFSWNQKHRIPRTRVQATGLQWNDTHHIQHIIHPLHNPDRSTSKIRRASSSKWKTRWNRCYNNQVFIKACVTAAKWIRFPAGRYQQQLKPPTRQCLMKIWATVNQWTNFNPKLTTVIRKLRKLNFRNKKFLILISEAPAVYIDGTTGKEIPAAEFEKTYQVDPTSMNNTPLNSTASNAQLNLGQQNRCINANCTKCNNSVQAKWRNVWRLFCWAKQKNIPSLTLNSLK